MLITHQAWARSASESCQYALDPAYSSILIHRRFCFHFLLPALTCLRRTLIMKVFLAASHKHPDHMCKTEITGPKRGSVQTEQTLGTLPDNRCSRLPGSNGQRASTHGG